MCADRPSPSEIRQTLKRLREEPELARSAQLMDILDYVVERTLAGEGDRLKAYAIATDVLRRSDSFDPQTDASVRVQAGRLRKALDALYARGVPDIEVRIDLPVGHYIPSFAYLDKPVEVSPRSQHSDPPENPPSSPDPDESADGSALGNVSLWLFRPLQAVAILVIVIGCVLLALRLLPEADARQAASGAERMPVLIVSDLDSSDHAGWADARVLKTMLIDRLRILGTFDIRLTKPESDGPVPVDLVYRLGGALSVSADEVSFRVAVLREASSEVLWTHSFVRDKRAESHAQTLQHIADDIAGGIGAANGAVQRDARAHLPESDFAGAGATQYACQLLFRDALGFGRVAETAAARTCFADRYANKPDDVLALAALGALDAFDAWRASAPGDNLSRDLQAQVQAGADAVRRFPMSSFAHELYGYVLTADASVNSARREFLAALDANPVNTDAAAHLGLLMALNGMPRGQYYAERAIAGTPWPSGWYFTVPALTGLIHADYAATVRNALTILPDDPEIGLALLVAAAPGAARSDLVDTYLPRLLEWKPFQAQGIIPRLSVRVSDQSMLEALRIGLIWAGIPNAWLNRPFAYVVPTD